MLSDKLSDKLGTDAFKINLMLAHRQVAMQMLFVDAAKGTQKVARRRPQAFGGVRVNLANTVAIVIARPFFLPMTHCVVSALDPVLPLPFIRVTGSGSFSVPIHVLLQRLAIGVVTHAQATLPTVAPDGAHNWGESISLPTRCFPAHRVVRLWGK